MYQTLIHYSGREDDPIMTEMRVSQNNNNDKWNKKLLEGINHLYNSCMVTRNYRLKYTKRQFYLLFCMGVKLMGIK
jgi:hypothetical protein